jgi:tartrate-resistant acid phosphatase type 5
MTRRQLLQLAAASGAVALVPSVLHQQSEEAEVSAAPAVGAKGKAQQKPRPGKPTEKSLRFVAFGDWGSGLKLQREVAAAMTRFSRESAAKGRPLDFAVSVGDNFYDRGVAGHDDPQWQLKFEEMYPREAMPFPFFAVLGNHDWVSNPATQFSYRGPSGRWRMDGFYYKVAAGEGLVDFFMVDTDLWLPQYHSEGLGDKQTRWLDESLAASTAKWKIVVGHHPPYTDGVHAVEKDMGIVRGIITPLLSKHGVQLMLSGHDHDLQHIVLPDAKTHFVVTGAGGASMRPRLFREYGPFYRAMTGGFLGLEANQSELKARFLSSKLETLHEWTQVAT